MNAKPQRLHRGLASHGNENFHPAKQAAHQRFKSTGNLKSIYAAVGISAAPKRNAFGDVSNIAKGGAELGHFDAKVRMNATSTIETIEKENVNKSYKEKAEPWKRGPEKQGNNLSQKSAVRTGLRPPAVPGIVPAPAPKGANCGAAPVVKQGISKKATFVYNDQKEIQTGLYPEIASLIDEPAHEADKLSRSPRHFKSQQDLKTSHPSLRQTQSKILKTIENLIDIDHLTGGPYKDALEQLSASEFEGSDDQSLSNSRDQVNKLASIDVVDDVRVTQKQVLRVEFEAEEVITQADSSRGTKSAYLASSMNANPETEDYWDEEDEQGLYDDQGYTTAHSYRSHGENTTSAVTAMLAPRETTQIQRELEIARIYVTQNMTAEEIEEDEWDMSMVAEYGDEIFDYMRGLEIKLLPNPHYMDIQTEIQWSMRAVLMDWLVQVHHRFTLLPETLFLAVNFIDRFLTVKIVSLGKLQLVGATALFLAAKYEEINCPSVQEVVFMVDSGYTAEEILKAERFMLTMLQFELGWPGPMSFLRRISKADEYDLDTRTMAKYLLEVTIMDERFVATPPSFLSAGAHLLSRLVLNKGGWTLSHVHYSGYTQAQLEPLVELIWGCCQDPRQHHTAVFEKYVGKKYKYVSAILEEEVKRGFVPRFSRSIPSSLPQPRDDDSFAEYDSVSLLIAAEGA